MKALIALFAAALCTTAVAGDKTSKHDESKSMQSVDAKFDKLDRNDDEQLSRTEAQEEDSLSAQFASVDQDADGFVSKNEFTAQLDTSETSEPRSEPDPY
jgi:hypothetical protein